MFYRKKIKDLEDQLSDCKRTITSLEEDLYEEREKISNLRNGIFYRDQDIDKLRKENSSLKGRLESSIENYQEKCAEVSQCKKVIETLRCEQVDMEGKMNDAAEYIRCALDLLCKQET